MKFARILIVLAVAAGLALVAAACGSDDDGAAAPSDSGDARTVEIDMVDIAFEPETLEVSQGETVRFSFTNRGEIAHDAFVGDTDAQAKHEAEMREAEETGDHGMATEDEDESAITVEPGQSRELTYTFDEAGTIEIGCHQPGHYGRGMKIDVEVA